MKALWLRIRILEGLCRSLSIQVAFLWFDQHLWEFEVAGRRHGVPFDGNFGGERVYKPAAARLSLLREAGTTEFLYVYDMDDDWQHEIEALEFFIAEPGSHLPRFLGGQRCTPPEDVGGPPGFEMFLEASGDPSHPEHAGLLDWYGNTFHQKDMDEETIKAVMGCLAKARPREK